MRVLGVDEARQILLSAAFPVAQTPAQVLDRLGCIQLDPIDRIGSNADLVLHARVPGVRRGDWATLQGFEHFAKERCLLPMRALPYYQQQAVVTPWWRLGERAARLDPGLIEAVYQELRDRGSATSAELSDHGTVTPLDWNGWRGTAKAGSLALEALWIQCRVICQGRRGGQRVYRMPPGGLCRPDEGYHRWALRERVRVAGLLSLNSGPWWSSLAGVRKGPHDDDALETVRVEGARGLWLTLREPPLDWRPDRRLRVMAPLDPLVWNRALVQHLWGFEYVWEVYKPAATRRWGYYVCPLLWRGAFVGRLEARRTDQGVELLRLWGDPPKAALRDALARLASLQKVRSRTTSTSSLTASAPSSAE